MPKYKYMGSGPLAMKTSKAGKEYVQRWINVCEYKTDGTVCAPYNVYLIGDQALEIDNRSEIVPGCDLFLDFNHKGYLQDMRVLPDPTSDELAELA